METSSDVSLVGIDWGTTHRRAYALNAQGQCTQDFADDQGALASKGRFASALDSALAQLHAIPKGVVMSGMVGSALGWQEVPYVSADVALTDLPQHLVPVHEKGGYPRFIVPGYCVRDAHQQPDVMRGEETQLLGACVLGHNSGWFVLPGTHSKWVLLEQGRIVKLRTYMTGELYDLLGRHGTLAAAAGTIPQDWDNAAFAAGLKASGTGALSHQLFGVRARVVSGDMPAANSRAYLSGLLIGCELKDVLHEDGAGQSTSTFQLIGSPELAKLYQRAAQLLELRFEIIDARAAFLSAMAHFQTHWNHP